MLDQRGSVGAELNFQIARAHTRLGETGHFVLSRATHHSFAGVALAESAEAGAEAAGELEQAISLYDAGPGPGEEHWFAGKPLAGIALAVIRLRSGALDGAAAALAPALGLPPGQRVKDVTERLGLVRAELAAPVFGRSAQARSLDEEIEDFIMDSVANPSAGLI